MKPSIPLMIAVFGVCAALPAKAGTVIANPDVNMSVDDVRALYTGDLQSKGGVPLEAVENSAEQASFLSAFLKTAADRYNSHWTKKSFREGVNPPKSCCSTDAQVIDFVKQTPGGVGYIAGAAPPGVKALASY